MAEMGDGGSRPVPDPTVLTTEALLREVLHLHQLLETRISGMEAVMEERKEQRLELKSDAREALADALVSLRREMKLITDNANAQITDLRRSVDELRERVSKVV
jgi:phage shock protein A